MGSVRQRRAKRNLNKATRRNKDSHRKVNITSNPIIQANWDYNLTLKQNYKKLGLTMKLGKTTGGEEKELVEKLKHQAAEQAKAQAAEVDENETDPSKIPEGEARIIRDEKGEVVKVIYGTKKAVSIDEDEQDEAAGDQAGKEPTKVIKLLETYAAQPSNSFQRHQSQREINWLEQLYNKYGDDYEKMKWDKKLNIYQQSAGDLRRRILKWRKSVGKL